MPEVVVTPEFEAWYGGLGEQDSDSVQRVVDLLEAKGVTLGYPHSSDLKGAPFALRELRVQSGGKPIRIFYAFDPKRQACLLLGADKTGDDRFYERFIPQAEVLWKRYLASI